MAQLLVDNVTLTFGGVAALSAVSLEVARGELVSVIGPNGAGKTSLLNVVSGFYHPQRGRVLFEGEEITRSSPHEITKRGIARAFQNIELFSGLTVLENLMLARHTHLAYGLWAAGVFYGKALAKEVENRRVVEEVIDFMELEPYRKALVGNLPYGVRKRVEVARALSLSPKLLLLDEPMAGMTLEEKEDMVRFILEIRAQGTTVILIEHDLGVVMDISDRVYVLDFGQVIAEGRPEEVARNPRVQEAYLGGGGVKALKPSYEMKRHTLPQLLRLRALQEGDRVALREKDYGIWNEITYAEYYEKALLFAHGLLSLGFQPGERLAIIADNIPEWLYAELGAQAVRGISVGVYQSSLPAEIAYMLGYTGASFVLAEDQEQVDKLYEIRSEIPQVRHVIYEDPKGMRGYRDPWLLPFAEVLERGREHRKRYPDAVEKLLLEASPEEVCHLSSTSGTTGRPKAAMLRHRNLVHMGVALQEVDPLLPTDDYLSFLPLAWIGEQMMSVAMALTGGFAVNFPEAVETAMQDLKEIGPHVMFSPPRVWESLQSHIWVRMSESYAFNRFVYERLLKVGYRAAEYRMRGRPMPWGLRLAYWLADQILFRPLRDQLGFLRLRRAYTGGAALGPDVFRFFHAIGVNLKQIYGQTEIIGIAFVHRDGDVRHDTVGRPIPGTEVRISEEGEILCRSDAVCAGYWERPEATAETFRDGWLHTGDAGYLTEDGHLVVIDRLSDVMRTERGTVFSPQFVENKLKFSPYIKEAVVFGDRKPYLAAFLNIDPQTVGKWAEDRGLAYTTYLDLSLKTEVAELIRKEVEKVNQELPEELKIRRFVLLYKLLDADDEELTRTGKVRRGLIAKRYAPLLEALYSQVQEVEVEAEYRYQDGTVQRVRARVPILEFREEVLA